MEDDLYGLLGVPRDASVEEMQASYKRLARLHHPDKAKAEAEPEKFVSIQKAWEVLRDPVARSCYNGSFFLPPSLGILLLTLSIIHSVLARKEPRHDRWRS